MRKIIHIDMDAFYASVEQRDNPALQGLPVIVGHAGGRGVVLTASYEARAFGVRSAMPGKEAKRLCPQGIFVPPRFAAYKEASNHIHEIFRRYTDIIEPLSLDEAYLDVTEDKLNTGSAIAIAKAIKAAIKAEINLTASAGVSVSKFVAKVASGMQKPDGLTFIPPEKIEAFMEALPVKDFYGVGKVTAEKMNKLGLFHGSDLKKLTREELTAHFGKAGGFYYNIVRGIDNRPVSNERETKSVSVENTFAEDTLDMEVLHKELEDLCITLFKRVDKHGLYGRTATIKVKYHDFVNVTRSRSVSAPLRTPEALFPIACELLTHTEAGSKKIRLLGVGVSGFDEPASTPRRKTLPGQLDLFGE